MLFLLPGLTTPVPVTKSSSTADPVQGNVKQETPQCDETRFSTLQPSIDMTGIRNERWQ